MVLLLWLPGGTGLGHVAVQALQHMTAKNIRTSAAFSMRR